MAGWIYNALNQIFGTGLVENLRTWMSGLFTALMKIFDGGIVSASVDIFAGIACSLLILYFFMDMTSQASRDMFTFEKLVISMIRLFVAFAVLLCLNDLIIALIHIGDFLYSYVSSDSFYNALFSGSGTHEGVKFQITREALEDECDGITGTINHLGMALLLTAPAIIAWVAKLVGYFVCTSNAVMIVVRGVFSPIAVVQCFEDGTRSSGIRYLKSFAASCISMAVIAVILIAASTVNLAMADSIYTDDAGNKIETLTVDNMDDVVTLGNIGKLMIPELVAVGAMAGGSQLAKEIVGV